MALSRECLLAIIAAGDDMQAALDLIAPEFAAIQGDDYMGSFTTAAASGWSVGDVVKLADVIHDALLGAPVKGAAPQYIRPAVRAQVIARDGYRCTYCDGSVTIPHLDHVVPRARGGPSTADNLVVSCQSCNASKKDRPLEEWRRRKCQ